MKYICENKMSKIYIDMENIKPNACILILGKREYVKVNECINLFSNQDLQNKEGYIVTYSRNNYHEFKNNFKYSKIRGHLNKDELYSRLQDNNTNYIICDYCLSFKTHDVLESVIECDNKLRIIFLQFPYSIKPELASKIDYILLYNDYSYPTAFTRINQYTNNTLDEPKFKEMCISTLNNGNFILINQTKQYDVCDDYLTNSSDIISDNDEHEKISDAEFNVVFNANENNSYLGRCCIL